MVAGPDRYQKQRAEMVNTIRWHVNDTREYTRLPALGEDVLAVMAAVPRHKFIPASQHGSAYSDNALSIGYGQTISQPFIVALMTDLLQTEAGHSVLEIGTGSGYQAAVLSMLVKRVYSVERVPELAERAARVLSQLGYSNVTVKSGNGCLGWPEFAPFDGIVVTAGGEVPPELVEQLKPGGRMVIPVDNDNWSQMLKVVEKQRNGDLVQTDVLSVRFVPLIKNAR